MGSPYAYGSRKIAHMRMGKIHVWDRTDIHQDFCDKKIVTNYGAAGFGQILLQSDQKVLHVSVGPTLATHPVLVPGSTSPTIF